MNDPYKKCPIFNTTNFTLRIIEKSDAEDLLECYSDVNAQKYFNTDNCRKNFNFKTIDEMNWCIDFWLSEYSDKKYVRFSIINKLSGKVVGTIEIFGWAFGVLRLDIKSEYEKREYLNEIIEIAINNFYTLFNTNRIITKAIPEGVDRIKALTNNGFIQYTKENYFFRDI